MGFPLKSRKVFILYLPFYKIALNSSKAANSIRYKILKRLYKNVSILFCMVHLQIMLNSLEKESKYLLFFTQRRTYNRIFLFFSYISIIFHEPQVIGMTFNYSLNRNYRTKLPCVFFVKSTFTFKFLFFFFLFFLSEARNART